MHYEKLIAQTEEEGITDLSREERLKELQEYIKSHNHLYDDHGSMVIGSRSQPPYLPKEGQKNKPFKINHLKAQSTLKY